MEKIKLNSKFYYICNPKLELVKKRKLKKELKKNKELQFFTSPILAEQYCDLLLKYKDIKGV
jgi:hypothetical protein